MWRLDENGDIKSYHDGWCLDWHKGGANDIKMHKCHGGKNQKWYFENTDDAGVAEPLALLQKGSDLDGFPKNGKYDGDNVEEQAEDKRAEKLVGPLGNRAVQGDSADEGEDDTDDHQETPDMALPQVVADPPKPPAAAIPKATAPTKVVPPSQMQPKVSAAAESTPNVVTKVADSIKEGFFSRLWSLFGPSTANMKAEASASASTQPVSFVQTMRGVARKHRGSQEGVLSM